MSRTEAADEDRVLTEAQSPLEGSAGRREPPSKATVELRTLGGTDVHVRLGDGTTRRVPLQPKRLALLAYLALARPRGLHRRDSLVVVFWPDESERGARNALSQTIHALRRELGADVLVSKGHEEVGVDHARVWCDAILLEARLEQRRFEEALDLFRGPLLQGLHVSDSIGFERWHQSEAWRLERHARDAAMSLAETAEGDRNPIAAVRWLERALEISPTDEPLIRRLLLLLDGLGDRSGALRVYDHFVTRLDEELGTPPSPETEAVADAIRRRRTEVPPRVSPLAIRREPIRSLAVLPLQNLTGNPEQDYFADGMTEMLIGELAAIGSLRLISAQSVKAFKGSDRPLRDVGETLGADAVVEGSVLWAGDRLRVTVQLVRVDPEEHVWAGAYDRDVRDVLALHAEVAASVAEEIEARLTSDERRRLHEGRPRRIAPAAYDHFLRGVALGGVSAYEEAIAHFHDAIAIDPQFAEPHAWLALAYGTLAVAGLVGPEVGERVRRAAARALELDPDLGAAHQAHAFCLQLFERDWKAADRAYTRGLNAGRRDPRALGWYLLFLVGQGRFEEGLATAEELRRSDPAAAPGHFGSGWALHKARRFQEAAERLEFTLAHWPTFAWTPPFLAASYAFLDRATEAIALTRNSLEAAPGYPLYLAYGTATLARCGAHSEALDARARLEDLCERQYVDPFHLGLAHAGLGEDDEALTELERILEEGSPQAWVIAPEPFFDPLRHEPRFRRVLRELDLPELAF
jgi:TolB-like protein/DNA-binding SARP family transcriptional activator